ncbi:hypothetical protein F5J12DRAFT_682254, partial [Pisolithus orientalis]|uniref:uncharacterized protein n=1 Tax=Pisolithus orientalis TaxID=936130 RepID=UPI002225A349
TDCLIEWCKTHKAACKKLFSDSTQYAWEEGRSKQQLCHRKNDIYVEIAKVIFSVGDESVKICALAQDNLGIFTGLIQSCLDVLKQKYWKYIVLLGQTGAGWTYNDLASNTSMKNIIGIIQKEFPWWGDLHGWWHMNPAYNSMWSGADSGQNFTTHAVRL